MRATRARTPLGIRIAAVAIVVGALGWYVHDWLDQRGNEHRLSAIASAIAGREVKVDCPGLLGRALKNYDLVGGTVQFDADGVPANKTKLRGGPCAELDAIAEGRRATPLECVTRSQSCGDDALAVAIAMDTVTHESFHLKGIEDEGITECYSLQTLHWTATQLGATDEQGRALARLIYETTYDDMPDQYNLPECADGAKLDLNPADPRFP